MQKKFTLKNLLMLMLPALLLCSSLNAQDFDDPVAYMNAITNAQQDMNRTYMAYMSASAHSHRDSKVEKMRQRTLESIIDCKSKIIDIPFYKGDKTLRQSSIEYIDFCYKIFNDDYAHIVNMEEIAEQSVDEMQAYLLLQEKTNEKLQEANNKMEKAVSDFAAKNNIKLIESKDELGDKINIANKLSHYCNQVYIIFFKCNWQDEQLTKAINNKKINDAEQARNALLAYTKEGLAALDTLKAFENDNSFVIACKHILNTYSYMADKDIPKVMDYFLKEENFEKIKKEMDKKYEKTKADVDAYNKAVNEINESVNTYNSINADMNKKRAEIIRNWNEVQQTFYDTHMPYYK